MNELPEVVTGDPAADLLLAQCASIIAIHEHLRMDTPEDEELRIRGVEIAKDALFKAAEAFAHDAKNRGPAYQRGWRDAVLACRAGAGPELAERDRSGSWWPVTDAERAADAAETERLWAEDDARREHDWTSDEENRG